MMRLVTALLLAGVSFQASADPRHWERVLQRDYVKVSKGLFQYESYALCRFEPRPGSIGLSTTVQVQSKATAPVKVMSRDSFVSIVAATEAAVTLGMASIQSTHSCTILEKAIGTPDLLIYLDMNDQGYQTRITDNRSGKSGSETTTWTEAFPDP